MRVATIDLRDIERSLGALKDKAPNAVFTAALVSAEAMLRDTIKLHMSGPKRGSQWKLLGVDTGHARRSMQNQAEIAGNIISAEIGSSLGYVKAHEEGFSGPVKVRAHTRRIVALSRNNRGKVSAKSAKRYKERIKAGKKNTAFVRAFTRKVNISAKEFIRYGVLGQSPQTRLRAMRSLEILARTGRVPAPSELGAR